MDNSPVDGDHGPGVEFDSATIQQIRSHACASMEAEICGVLVGTVTDGVTRVQACIPGENADHGGAHVTFTHETWQHIYRIKDAQYADSSIVGWYHSHPGFGIFLSDYDIFIHKNFFTARHQIAWVFDPHSNNEGCFAWVSPGTLGLVAVSVIGDNVGVSDTAKPAIQAAIAPETVVASRDWKKHFFNQALRTVTAVTRAVMLYRPLLGKRVAQARQQLSKLIQPEQQSPNTTSGKEDGAEKASAPSSPTSSQRKNNNTKGE
jgi:proteasome lid subunit RPN8/RPN11